MKVLLDTNVVLDIALDRQPFAAAACEILEAAGEAKELHLCIGGSSATDIYYVLRKEVGGKPALEFLEDLLLAADVCEVNKPVLARALATSFADFEDAVQSCAAELASVDLIVTRNVTDYKESALPAITPNEFVGCYLRGSSP